MGMTEAEFFGQSIILWNRRIKGFLELHGAGEGGGAETPFTKSDLERLEQECENIH